MKLIVGLGNPGPRYAATRHNAGRMVVECFADSCKVKFTEKSRLEAGIACFETAESAVVLAYGMTAMNLSGRFVRKLTEHFEVRTSSDLLILVDDLALPFGKLRLRASGTDGGHNGLKSIHEAFGNTAYPRLRIGIQPMGWKDGDLIAHEVFVLQEFSKQEKQALDLVLGKAAESCRLWLEQPISRAMNAVNVKSL
ncbi:MAG: aminoacyl-tRNA hydrolase [Omnitrophica bacterium GWA2_52_8]|nr:MAG: aminoacyl-tRNA hydrolase [Omnitrophica bacterium GWA2_52_8]